MSKQKKYKNLEEVPDDIFMVYYNHQYERVKILEGQSLTVTNLVISLSVVALSLGLNQQQEQGALQLWVGLAILLVMFFVNLFAIAYILSNKSWKKTHQKRAHETLKERVPSLHEFNENTHDNYKSWLPGRTQFQVSIHVILMLVALGMFILYLVVLR